MARGITWEVVEATIINEEAGKPWAMVKEVSSNGHIRIRAVRANLKTLKGIEGVRLTQLKLPTI